jgi:hypothetical protein
MEHWVDKQGENCSKYGPQKGIGSHCARCVLLECIDEIIQRRLKDCEESESHAEEPDAGSEPEDVFVGRPPENEQPSSKQDRPSHHRRQTGLWNCFAAILLEPLSVKFVISEWVSNVQQRGRSDLQNISSTTRKGP